MHRLRDKGKVIDGADECAQVLLVVVLRDQNQHQNHVTFISRISTRTKQSI